MDTKAALADVEISLRNVIEDVLKRKHGLDWINKAVITPDRLKDWQKKLDKEKARRPTAAADERLLYYSDFSDLRKIINDNWSEFSDILKDQKEIDVFLARLLTYRNPTAHHRRLFPHEENIILGTSLYIRTLIAKYMNALDGPEAHFPKIDCVIESLGHTSRGGGYVCQAGILRPGTEIEYVVSASDPNGEPLQYRLLHSDKDWQDSEKLSLKITEADIRVEFMVQIWIRNTRIKHHANPGGYDDVACFLYTTLPNNNTQL